MTFLDAEVFLLAVWVELTGVSGTARVRYDLVALRREIVLVDA